VTESQTRCTDCGAAILQRTADRHDGRCVRCHRKAVGAQLRAPRPHHYAFAHDHLPGVLWHDPRMLLFALFNASELFREDQLRIRWQVVGERFDSAERLGDEGLCCSIHTLANGFQTAVITLPPARGPTEAHMVAIVYRPAQWRLWFWKTEPVLRYLTLELGFDRETNECLTLLCEWTRHGQLNYDKGPAPDVAAFLEAIQELLTTDRATSAAFIRPRE
jgi:hypothetical protein